MTDSLETWEQWPIGGLVAAAGLNTALWYAGGQLPAEATAALPWITLVAAVASVVAIDGALVATIAGMRLGRYSGWSVSSIVVAGLFTMLAALAAHQTLPGLGPWLHGVFALTFVTYAMHLAQPRADVVKALEEREQAFALNRQVHQAEMNRRASEVTRVEQALVERAAELDRREQALINREQRPIRLEQVETIRIATAELTWKQFEQVVSKALASKAGSLGTLRRLVSSVEQEGN